MTTLKWSAVPNAAHYVIAIDGVKKIQVAGGGVTTMNLDAQPTFKILTPGTHTVTITAVDKKGVVGKPSLAYSFTKGTAPAVASAPASTTQLAAPAVVSIA